MTFRKNTPVLLDRGRRLRRRRGGALIEAALVMPILLGLCFGMVEFGYFFFVKHTLQAEIGRASCRERV